MTSQENNDLYLLQNLIDRLKLSLKRGSKISNMEILKSIYAFKNVFRPRDDNWRRRMNEEILAFSIFKHGKDMDYLPHFKSLIPSMENNSIFYVKIRKGNNQEEIGIIKLPIYYPYKPPVSLISTKGYLEVYTQHTDPKKCLGELVSWDSGGKMGIAHWLLIVEFYIALTKHFISIKTNNL